MQNLINEMDYYVDFMYNIPPSHSPEKYLLVDNSTVNQIKDCVLRFSEIYRYFDEEIRKKIVDLANNLFLPMVETQTGYYTGSYAIDKIRLGRICAYVNMSRAATFQEVVRDKPARIFISHATKDASYVKVFVEMLEKIGVKEGQLFCSSVDGYKIPLGADIYDFLRSQFNEYNLYIILMLSKNFYISKPCMNEMGAAWVLKADYQTILLPGFTFKEIEGAVNPNKLSFSLSDIKERTCRLTELKDTIISKLGLAGIGEISWERHRNEFLELTDKITAAVPKTTRKKGSTPK